MSEFEDKLIKERYCIDGESSWADVCHRVAKYIGNNPEQEGLFFALLESKTFLPNSPTLMNAGTNNPMLSACFYIPVEDSIDSIFDANKNAAKIFQKGGGVGFNFSNIRPAGSKVGNRNGVASGVVSFMRVFDTMTEVVKQGGARRGAMMGSLNITHPEIRQFLTCKSEEGTLANFNISVKLTDEFMNGCLIGGELQRDRMELMDMIVDGIYKNGEPGILFTDTIERKNPCPEFGELNPNPCGEALLAPYESCNLGSINLAKHVDGGKINYRQLENTIHLAVAFLNNVIDKNKYPIPEIAEASKRTRKIGLGVMGLHDALIMMDICYDSRAALNFADEVMSFINNTAHRISCDLGHNGNIQHLRLNASLTSIAPTGTISIIAGASSGIEPVFNWVYTRRDTLGEHYIVHPLFEKALENFVISNGRDRNEVHDVVKHCHEKGTIQDIEWLPATFKALFVNAMDISPSAHVHMQAAFQKHVDMSISKTINLPNSATKNQIKQIIFEAWAMGCKGITIYRNGSRENEVLSLKQPKTAVATGNVGTVEQSSPVLCNAPITPQKRPRALQCAPRVKAKSGCGNLYMVLGEKDGRPYEFTVENTHGGCEALLRAIANHIRLEMRHGIPMREIIKTCKEITCSNAYHQYKMGKCDGKSCSDIIGDYLKEMTADDDEDKPKYIMGVDPAVTLTKGGVTTITGTVTFDEQSYNKFKDAINNICPECGAKIIHDSGCMSCKSCGWNKCK